MLFLRFLGPDTVIWLQNKSITRLCMTSGIAWMKFNTASAQRSTEHSLLGDHQVYFCQMVIFYFLTSLNVKYFFPAKVSFPLFVYQKQNSLHLNVSFCILHNKSHNPFFLTSVSKIKNLGNYFDKVYYFSCQLQTFQWPQLYGDRCIPKHPKISQWWLIFTRLQLLPQLSVSNKLNELIFANYHLFKRTKETSTHPFENTLFPQHLWEVTPSLIKQVKSLQLPFESVCTTILTHKIRKHP